MYVYTFLMLFYVQKEMLNRKANIAHQTSYCTTVLAAVAFSFKRIIGFYLLSVIQYFILFCIFSAFLFEIFPVYLNFSTFSLYFNF